jgi:hypothetical protein
MEEFYRFKNSYRLVGVHYIGWGGLFVVFVADRLSEGDAVPVYKKFWIVKGVS